MNNHELISVPDDIKVPVIEEDEIFTDAPIEVPVEFDPSSPNFYVPHLSGALGKSALAGEVSISKDLDGDGIIDSVPGITRTEPSYMEPVEIKPVGDPAKFPGTEAYRQRQEDIANLAHSEVAVSNAHRRD
jgi:hypothetical protein